MEKEDLSTLLPLTTVPIVDPTEGLGLTFEDSALKQAKDAWNNNEFKLDESTSQTEWTSEDFGYFPGVLEDAITTSMVSSPGERLQTEIPPLWTDVQEDSLMGRLLGDGMEEIIDFDQESQVDMLEIPGKGRCYVYLARYTYDPYLQSLNDNPENELPLAAGDYVLIWDHADEDGFFMGELLDGRKGLVPSNFLEKLYGDDLFEFHRMVVFPEDDTDNEFLTVVPNHISYDHEDSASDHGGVPDMYHEDLHLLNATYLSPEENINDEITQDVGDHYSQEAYTSSVPAPKHLTLERQLNKSILISWQPPDAYQNQIEMYHVYVNGFLRTTVKATEKTKALVEGVDSSKPHRISVRSVLVNRKTSKDAACTMIIGKDAPLGPSCVKAHNVTATSALITWLPSNSNFQHTVCINNVEVRTVKPGVFKHVISGLTPNTHYKVTIRAKNIKASPYVDEKNLTRLLERLSAHTEFRTLDKALPDPPMDVRVDGGPQDGTLLVTWIPVPDNLGKHDKVTPVTGYAVFADGKRVTDVDSPSSDHALIDLGCIGHFNPKFITVRSKSRDLMSTDSTAVPVQGSKSRKVKQFDPRSIKHPGATLSTQRYGKMGRSSREWTGQLVLEQQDENISDKEMYARNVPAIEITKESPSEFDQITDEDDIGLTRKSRHHPKRKYSRHPAQSREYSRIFVALFDYDPPTMSPNPEACEDELSFCEGQLIKVIGEKDSDGFYWGECNGRRGFIPCNMVSEVQVDDDQVFKEDMRKRRSNRFVDRTNWTDTYASANQRKMIALYDYDPQELSPNVDAEVELKFQTGDIINVFGDMDDDGFYLAELRGQRGLVPSNFLADAKTEQQPQQQQHIMQQQQQPQQQQPQKRPGGLLSGLMGPAAAVVQSAVSSTPAAPSGASGPPPPPREPGRGLLAKAMPTDVRGFSKPGLTDAVAGKIQPEKKEEISAAINLDRIPGLDDFDDDPLAYAAPTTTATATKPTTSLLGGPAKTGAAAGAKTGQEEGGLLGAVTGGLTQGISGLAGGGVSGITGKLGDLAGTASSAGGGLLSSGKGLFKKFGF